MTDYLIEIMKARREFYRIKNEFVEILDKWEEEHRNMAEFHIMFWRDKTYKEIELVFNGEVNNEVITLLCDEFNLQVIDKYTLEYIYDKIPTRTSFILRHKKYPFGLKEV